MSQPRSVVEAPDDLLALFGASQAKLEAEYAAILTDPQAGRRRARLRQLIATVTAETAKLEAAAGVFVADVFPVIYEAGGTAAIGGFRWDTYNRQALELLQDDTMSKILAATEHMAGDSKRWVRETTRKLAVSGQVEGKTAAQLAREFARLAPKAVNAAGLPTPITAITYADGSVRTLATYSDVLMRTQTGIVYNHGAVNTGVSFGVTRFEIADGPGCGLTSHDDGSVANGMIVDARTALAYPLSHPNCRRSISGRPDLDGTPVPPIPERAGPPIQIPVPTRAAAQRQARAARTARNARTPRTART